MVINDNNSPYIGLTGGSLSSTIYPRWKFCPGCGTKLDAAWKHCAECGKVIGATLASGYYWPTIPATAWQSGQATQRCAFDGLPPGAYNLVCFCPKCTPHC